MLGTKTWTGEELDKMNIKQLGRLRAHGVDVGDRITRKRKELKEMGHPLKRGKKARDEEVAANA